MTKGESSKTGTGMQTEVWQDDSQVGSPHKYISSALSAVCYPPLLKDSEEQTILLIRGQVWEVLRVR
jgi:hypothetical protein